MNHQPHPAADELPATDLADFAVAVELLHALASPVRLALVHLVDGQPSCVHDLVDALGIPQPQVSQHLRKLRAAGLVVTRRRGREVIYQLSDDHVGHIARDAISHAREHP